ncbi:MAG: hypothetical protein ACI9IP_000090, partial [Arcticibacterium sp.]
FYPLVLLVVYFSLAKSNLNIALRTSFFIPNYLGISTNF